MEWLNLTNKEDKNLYETTLSSGEPTGLPICPYNGQSETVNQHKCPKFEFEEEGDYCSHVLFVGKLHGFCEIAKLKTAVDFNTSPF